MLCCPGPVEGGRALPVGRKGGKGFRGWRNVCTVSVAATKGRLMKLLGEPVNVVACTLNSSHRMDDCRDDYQDFA